MVNPRMRDPDPPPSSDLRGSFAWDIRYKGERDRHLGSDMNYRGISPTRSSRSLARSPNSNSRKAYEDIDWEGKYHVVKERETLLDSQLKAKAIMLEEQADEIGALKSHCDTMTKALNSKEEESQLLQQAIESIQRSHSDSLGGREPHDLVSEIQRLEGMLHTSHAEGRKVYIELKQVSEENHRQKELLKSLQDELRLRQQRGPMAPPPPVQPPVQTPPPPLQPTVVLHPPHDHPAVSHSMEPQLLSFSPPRSGRSKEKPPNFGARRNSGKKQQAGSNENSNKPQSASARARKGQEGSAKAEPNVEHARALQQIASLTDSLRGAQADNDTLRAEIESLRANTELIALRDERARFHAEGDRTAKEIQRLRSELERFQHNPPVSPVGELSDLRAENARLKDDLAALHSKTKNVPSQEELASLKDEVRNLRSDNEDLRNASRSASAAAQDNFASELQRLKSDYNDSCKKVEQMADENRKLRSSLSQLSTDYDSVCSDLQEHKLLQQQNQDKIASLESRNRDLLQQLDRSNATVASDEIELLKARVSALNRERDILKKKSSSDINEGLLERNQQLSEEIESKNREISRLRSDLQAQSHPTDDTTSLLATIANQKQTISDMESEIAALRHKEAAQENLIKSHDQQIATNSNLQSENAALREKVRHLQADVDAMHTTSSRSPSKSEIDQLTREVSDLREREASQRHENEMLRNRLIAKSSDTPTVSPIPVRGVSSGSDDHLHNTIELLKQENEQLKANPTGGSHLIDEMNNLRIILSRLKAENQILESKLSSNSNQQSDIDKDKEINRLLALIESSDVNAALLERNKELALENNQLHNQLNHLLEDDNQPSRSNTHLYDEISSLRDMLSTRDINPSLLERNKQLVGQVDDLKRKLASIPNKSQPPPTDNSHLLDEIAHLRSMLRSNNVDPALIERNKELVDQIGRLKNEPC
eukprot:TRINITY_DN1007_c0_g1_i2.p1 TRINITY_DN1007_c0_g1~~TRINITY_DN1007_c0_g1_i2.p1  ORF type:complete len:945 (+),score=244.70 TRINITY_DN1007_c0_g1_i2:117-2951(+)